MHSTIDSTAHSRPLNSLEHKLICIYMHNLDDEPPTRPRCKPSTSAFRATTGPNEPSGLGILYCQQLASTECVLIKKTQLIVTHPNIYLCQYPWEAMQEPCRCAGGATRYLSGRVPWRILASNGRAPVRLSENWVSFDSRAAPAGTRQNSGRISVKHDFIMTIVYSARGPPGTKIPAALTAQTGPGLIVT